MEKSGIEKVLEEFRSLWDKRMKEDGHLFRKEIENTLRSAIEMAFKEVRPENEEITMLNGGAGVRYNQALSDYDQAVDKYLSMTCDCGCHVSASSSEEMKRYGCDVCSPNHDEVVAGEKPGETWEELLYALGNECSFDWDGAPERLESFIASEIQSAVEAERRRISEEAAYIESHKAFHCRFDELVKVINPKK